MHRICICILTFLLSVRSFALTLSWIYFQQRVSPTALQMFTISSRNSFLFQSPRLNSSETKKTLRALSIAPPSGRFVLLFKSLQYFNYSWRNLGLAYSFLKCRDAPLANSKRFWLWSLPNDCPSVLWGVIGRMGLQTFRKDKRSSCFMLGRG